jgi:mannose-6-phosphate isomerase-like protein (cupin superfamily)
LPPEIPPGTPPAESDAAAGLHALYRAIRAAAQALRADADADAVRELDHLIGSPARMAPMPGHRPRHADAVASCLPGLLDGNFPPALAPVAAALGRVWRQLDWHYHYSPRDDAPNLDRTVAFAELAGDAAPLAADAIRVGFTFMAPGVLYPSHAHPAVELYVVLSGRALWTQSGRSAWRDPGALIVHASEEHHAMQTVDAPLLALYAWRGDIDAPARYV